MPSPANLRTPLWPNLPTFTSSFAFLSAPTHIPLTTLTSQPYPVLLTPGVHRSPILLPSLRQPCQTKPFSHCLVLPTHLPLLKISAYPRSPPSPNLPSHPSSRVKPSFHRISQIIYRVHRIVQSRSHSVLAQERGTQPSNPSPNEPSQESDLL